jgi:hypothetical protein
MAQHRHRSPIHFAADPAESELWDDWKIIIAYHGEKADLGIVDLSYWSKYDIQDRKLSNLKVDGTTIPESPGQVYIGERFIIARLTYSQASIWYFRGKAPVLPEISAITDITDGYALIGLYGARALRIMDKICSLDLARRDLKPPYLQQGPVLHLPANIITLGGKPNNSHIIMAFARGYGQAVVEAIFDAGKEFGLKPAGKKRFMGLIKTAAFGGSN